MTSPDQNCLISGRFVSGANGIRTRDLLRAKQALSQLSYGPDLVASLEAGRSAGHGSLVEVEVLRRTLLEPQAVVIGRVLQELRRLLEDVLALDLRELQVVLGRVAAEWVLALCRGWVGGRWRPVVYCCVACGSGSGDSGSCSCSDGGAGGSYGSSGAAGAAYGSGGACAIGSSSCGSAARGSSSSTGSESAGSGAWPLWGASTNPGASGSNSSHTSVS